MSELLNLIGLSTGIVLYAMLLAMVVRRDTRTTARRALDPLLLSTALLGLLWNLCALPVYALPRLGVRSSLVSLTVVGFAALGFLPAVVVQSVLRSEDDGRTSRTRRAIAAAAFGVSGLAALLQVRAAAMGLAVPSAAGMQLLTYAYVGLALPVAVVTRGQAGARRALWIAALSIFAVSALHLSQAHQGDGSWPIELLGHHASVPLALAMLYQDYPFALADLFLKRALTLLVLITGAFLSVTTFHTGSMAGPVGGVREVGGLVVLWVMTALLYPRLARSIGRFVDGVILHRPDYGQVIETVARRAREEQDITALLDRACEELAPTLSARTVLGRVQPTLAMAMRSRPHFRGGHHTATETPQRHQVTDLTGGRRLLSDDYGAPVHRLTLGRRIDAIRLMQNATAVSSANRKYRLATEASSRRDRRSTRTSSSARVTTIGYLIQTSPDRAVDTLLKLTSLLRGVLRSDGEFTTLGRELAIISLIWTSAGVSRTACRCGSIPPPTFGPCSSAAAPAAGETPSSMASRRAAAGRGQSRRGLEESRDRAPVLVVTVCDSGLRATDDGMSGRSAGVAGQHRASAGRYYGPRASLSIVTMRLRHDGRSAAAS